MVCWIAPEIWFTRKALYRSVLSFFSQEACRDLPLREGSELLDFRGQCFSMKITRKLIRTHSTITRPAEHFRHKTRWLIVCGLCGPRVIPPRRRIAAWFTGKISIIILPVCVHALGVEWSRGNMDEQFCMCNISSSTWKKKTLFHWDFFHGWCGSLSPAKASCNKVVLTIRQCMLFFSFSFLSVCIIHQTLTWSTGY